MRKQLLALVTLLSSGLALTVAAGGTDKEKLQGSWELTKITFGDVTFPLAKERMLLILQGNQATHLRGDKVEDETTFALDEKKNPRTITFAKTAKEKEIRGIYQVDGKVLIIAITKPGSAPPATLEAREALVYTFKKADKEKK